MAMLKMQRVTVYSLMKYCNDILEALQRRGVVQIENVDIQDEVFFKEDTTAIRAQYSGSAKIARDAAQILAGFVPQKKSLLSAFEGRRQISPSEYDALADETQDILKVAYDIINYQKTIDSNEAEKVKYQAQLDAIRPWLGLDVPMTFSGTSTTRAFIGKFPELKTSGDITKALAELIPDVEGIDVEVIYSDENQTCVFVLASKHDADAVQDALRRIGFEYPSYRSQVIPKQREREINKHLSNRDGRIQEAQQNIKACAGYYDKLEFLEDYFVMKAERYTAFDDISSSNNTFVLSGYIAAEDGGELKAYLEKTFDAEVELEDSDTDDTPIKLKNNKFAEPTESVLASYSYPDRNEADPTSVMAIFYYIFFGMMFSDAGYGLVMALACAWALKKFKTMEAGLRRSVKMFFWCGVSTTIWGLLFGSFFGDAVSVISTTFFHTPAPPIPGLVEPIWFNPVTNPMQMLMFSFLLGIIHLFAGLAIMAYNDIRHKQYAAVLYDVISWYLLVGGAILALLSMEMMGNIAGFTAGIRDSRRYHGRGRSRADPAVLGQRKHESHQTLFEGRLRAIRSHRVSQRYPVLQPSARSGTRYRRYRSGFQPDRQHDGQRHPWNNHIHDHIRHRTRAQYRHQRAGCLCPHQQAAICRILRQVLYGRRTRVQAVQDQY